MTLWHFVKHKRYLVLIFRKACRERKKQNMMVINYVETRLSHICNISWRIFFMLQIREICSTHINSWSDAVSMPAENESSKIKNFALLKVNCDCNIFFILFNFLMYCVDFIFAQIFSTFESRTFYIIFIPTMVIFAINP